MNLIVAVSENWGIGKNGDLLFHIKEDMKYFRQKTIGNTVVMGRKTLDSMPGGLPLKDRENIVLTRDLEFKRDGVIAVHSVDELMEKIKGMDKDVFVIGGGEIYSLLLPYCDKAYVTKVYADKEADTFFEDLEKCGWIREMGEIKGETIKYSFDIYKRL